MLLLWMEGGLPEQAWGGGSGGGGGQVCSDQGRTVFLLC